MSDKQEQADEVKMTNLSLADRISYSTITIALYQRQAVKQEIIASIKNVEPYQPGLGSELNSSLKSGWTLLKGFIVFVTRFWSLLLLGITGYLFYKKYFTRTRK